MYYKILSNLWKLLGIFVGATYALAVGMVAAYWDRVHGVSTVIYVILGGIVVCFVVAMTTQLGDEAVGKKPRRYLIQ